MTLAGTLNVSLLSGFVPANGASFAIIQNDGTDAVSRHLHRSAGRCHVHLGGDTFVITYAGSFGGNDVVLTAYSPIAYTVTTTADAGALAAPGNYRRQCPIEGGHNPFQYPGGGVQTISPASALPTISEAVNIDASSQPGYAIGAPEIELDGTGAGNTSGFVITASNVTIRGFAINRFSTAGVLLTGSGAIGDLIAGNLIGTNATGASASANVYECPYSEWGSGQHHRRRRHRGSKHHQR